MLAVAAIISLGGEIADRTGTGRRHRATDGATTAAMDGAVPPAMVGAMSDPTDGTVRRRGCVDVATIGADKDNQSPAPLGPGFASFGLSSHAFLAWLPFVATVTNLTYSTSNCA